MDTTTDSQYEDDVYLWTMSQVDLLRKGYLDKLDIEHLIEELKSMADGKKDKIDSKLRNLLHHLLKWEYQPSLRKKGNTGWQINIDNSRDDIDNKFVRNPSLRDYIPEAIPSAYKQALRHAVRDTRLPLSAFPETCPWTAEQVLDVKFFPGVPVEEKPPEKKK